MHRVPLSHVHRTAIAAAIFLALTACGDSNDKAPSGNLLRVDQEPDGDNCATGGVAINNGLDADEDGELGDDEIATTNYVCNGGAGEMGDVGSAGDMGIQGSPGPSGLPGISCWDLDGDGVNDPEEDIDGDTFFDAADCVGPEGPAASLNVYRITAQVVSAGCSVAQVGATCNETDPLLGGGCDAGRDQFYVTGRGPSTGSSYLCRAVPSAGCPGSATITATAICLGP